MSEMENEKINRSSKARDRNTDKSSRKYAPLIHYVAAIVVGWMAKTYYAGRSVLDLAEDAVGLVDNSIDWVGDIVSNFGGLAVIGSFVLIVFNIYEIL